MKLAVIGGAGFIGRHLCRYLVECGHQVTATTRQPDQAAQLEADVSWLPLDLLDDVPTMPDFTAIDCVIYLAGRAHVLADSSDDPLSDYRKLNRDAALAVAAAASGQGVGRFIYLSSIGVNGIENQRPLREDDAPAPCEAYARSKLEAEQSLAELCAARTMELVVLRPPLVYGNGAPGNFSRLLRAVENGRWLPLGMVDNRRSLIGIENLVQVIEICSTHAMAADQLFLVADGEDVSTAHLIKMIAEALGKPARLLPVPVFMLKLAGMLLGKSGEVNRVCGSLQVDSSKARQALDWVPRVTMRQGLRQLRTP